MDDLAWSGDARYRSAGNVGQTYASHIAPLDRCGSLADRRTECRLVGQRQAWILPLPDRLDQRFEESCQAVSRLASCSASTCDLRRAINSDKKIEFALFAVLTFGESIVNQKPIGYVLNFFLFALVAFDVRQPADPMPLQTAMQRRARQMRDRRLQGVEANVAMEATCALRKATIIASLQP